MWGIWFDDSCESLPVWHILWLYDAKPRATHFCTQTTLDGRAILLMLAIQLLHAHGLIELCFHMSRTCLKSSQILLCHKLFQLRKYAIIPLITFYFDERSRLFFSFSFFLFFLFLNVCCIELGEPSFPFFAYFGISHVSARRQAQGPAGAHAPLSSGFGVPGTGRAVQAALSWLSPASAFPA